MNHQELRQLCERIIAIDDPADWADRPFDRPRILQEASECFVAAPKLARQCLRLLAENEAMRGVVEAAQIVCDTHTEKFPSIKMLAMNLASLSKLETTETPPDFEKVFQDKMKDILA